MTIKELREKTGVGMMFCRKAIEYSNGNEKIAMAYIKAKTLAIATPKLTFDERVKIFIEKDKEEI